MMLSRTFVSRSFIRKNSSTLRWLASSSGNGSGISGGIDATAGAASDAGSSSSPSYEPFRPRRRPSKNYRPLKQERQLVRPPKRGPRGINQVTGLTPEEESMMFEFGTNEDADDELERMYGPDAADILKEVRRDTRLYGEDSTVSSRNDIESFLRFADYMTSEPNSTEDLVGERRAIAMSAWDEEDRKDFLTELDKDLEKERIKLMELGDDAMLEPTPFDSEKNGNNQTDDEENKTPSNQLAHGPWAETIVRVDRVQKVVRGGTIVRFRSLVVGGNANGCGGFGVGKASSPRDATEKASRMAKRNIFFVDRFLTTGITRDLVGLHNSCKVVLRAVRPNRGLKGHDLISQILVYMGITDCSSKSYGNRNPYNVVYATFKALMTHESIEEVSLKRGKRLLNLDRIRKLNI